MTFVVPFDGTDASRRGLVRAVELASPAVDVVAFTAIPAGNVDWARERELLKDDAFELDAVTAALEARVHDVDPGVEFEYATVDQFAPPGAISHEIRSFAREHEASMVFVGSDDAGGVVTSLQSVGSHVASDEAYDVALVRRDATALR